MPEHKELRLALGMRGGVSLAVWIGGVCAEIDALVRAGRGDPHKFWGKQLRASEFDRVVVDVMAGASAGGLNGVLFAASLRHGFPMSELRRVWSTVGDIDALRRTAPPWTSLLDGDGAFLETTYNCLNELVNEHRLRGSGGEEYAPYIDLRLSATLVEPVVMATVGPNDEQLQRYRSSAMFHFRRQEGVPLPTDDFERAPEHLRRLAVAARATASFPVAFEPAVVRSNRPAAFGTQSQLIASPLVDCGAVFSERRGSATTTAGPVDSDFLVADGGIVDNIPLGKVIDAVAAAPARGPTTRYLLYLHPTGPSRASTPDRAIAPLDPEERRRVVALARGVVAAKLTEESIDGDMAQLEAARGAVKLARRLRSEIVRQLETESAAQTEGDPPGTQRQEGESAEEELSPLSVLVTARVPAYTVQRAVVGASYVRRLLDDPIGSLGGDPFPEVGADCAYDPPEDRWRAPLTQWPKTAREELDAALASVETGTGALDASLFLVGLGPLRRVIHLLIEWIRAMESERAKPVLGNTKRRLYELSWLLVSVLDHYRNLGWIVSAGVSPAAIDANDWCHETVGRLNRLLCVRPALGADIVDNSTDAIGVYVASCEAALQGMIAGDSAARFDAAITELRSDAGDEVDLRAVFLSEVRRCVEQVLAATASSHIEPISPAALLDRVLRTGDPLENRLAMLEVVCFPEFLAGATTNAIEFRRISAAAPTPLAKCFAALREETERIEGPNVAWDRLAPNAKLAGNELSNFSAFFKGEWRDNDWLWGRLDAVPTLIDLLLPAVPVEGASQADTDARLEQRRGDLDRLTEERQRAIIAEHFQISLAEVDEHIKTYRVGLEQLDETSVPGISDSLDGLVETAAHVAMTYVPQQRHVQRYVIRPVRYLLRMAIPLVFRSRSPSAAYERASTSRRAVVGWITSFLVAVVVIWLAFGLAESKIAVLGGFVAGVSLAVVPLFFILRALTRSLPARPARTPPGTCAETSNPERATGVKTASRRSRRRKRRRGGSPS